MQMPKPSEADKERFRGLVAEDERVEVKPMFGNLGAFVNGNMFAGLFGSDVGVKLDEAGQVELGAHEGAGPFGPAERPMGGYLTLPSSFTDEEATTWMERAREYVATLPPKAAKPKKK
jgi:TfoX/Sxy family transcriptional regulator of competence genes